jgi:hypothetical protein
MFAIMPCVEQIPTSDSAPLVIRQEHPLERPDWDVWISGQPRLSFFHSAAWASVLQRTYGFLPAYFVATRERQLAAVLPLMEINSWLTGRRGASLPFTDSCEPSGNSESAQKDLFQAALKHGRARGWKYLECRGGEQMLDDAKPSVSFLGHRMSLFGDTDYLFTRLHSPVRRAIRKAEKSGLTVEISQGLGAIRAYYGLHCKTRREHGLPPQPFRFFYNIHEHILAHNFGVVVTVKLGRRPIASAVFFRRGVEAIYRFGASDNRFQDLRANNLVMWEAIKWHARRGIKTLHFGRTSLADEGLRRYKLGWGVDEHRINYYKYDLHKDTFVRDTDNAHGWHNRVFRALPVLAARGIGALLYKHVA